MKAKEIILLSFLMFVIGFIVGFFLSKNIYYNNENSPVISSTTQIDTVTVYRDSISIKYVPKIKYITKYENFHFKDTVYMTRAFIAAIDTVIKKDTINIKYIYPLNQFNVGIKFGPDSIYNHRITIVQQEYIHDPWYIKPVYAIGGIILGFGLGSIK